VKRLRRQRCYEHSRSARASRPSVAMLSRGAL
jgi:hypothetical protein